jgi:phage protein D
VVFDGAVTRVRGYAGPHGQRLVTVVALDPAHRMHRLPRSHNHEGALSAIVRAVFGPYGLAEGAVTLADDPAFTAEAPLRQSAETDWAFLQRVARAHGCYAFVEFNEGASKFYFVSAASLTAAEPVGELDYANGSGSLLAFTYKRAAAHAAPQQQVATVDPTSGDVLAATPEPRTPDPPAEANADQAALLGQAGPEATARYNAAAELAAGAAVNPADLRPVTILAGVPSDPTLAARAARPDPTRAQGWYGTGVAPGMPLLRAKTMLTLRGVGAWAEERPWYVEQARHVVRGGAYHTQFVVTR